MGQKKTKRKKIAFGPNRLKTTGAGTHGGSTKQKNRRQRKKNRQEMKEAARKGGSFASC